MPILPVLIYDYNVIPTKIPPEIIKELDKVILKLILTNKEQRTSKNGEPPWF